nr:MAG TPA: Cro/C1-type HTH DNA-binding domain protein [Caudoviricetes sp.]
MIRIRLKAMLAEKGIKQKDLAAMTGIRQPTLSGMNNNSVKHIPLDVLDKICIVLDCQPGELLEYVPDEKSPDE